MTINGYVGTYTTNQSQGIYQIKIIGNKIDDIRLFAHIQNPKYLAFAGKDDQYIAAVCDLNEKNTTYKSGVALFDKKGNKISSLAYEDKTSCFIACKNNFLYTANYHEGTCSIIKVEENCELSLMKKIHIKPKAGCHQVLFFKDKFLVPCLFLDKIFIYDSNYVLVQEISFPENSGPRHAVFSKDNEFLYVVGELDNIVYTIRTCDMKIVSKAFILGDNISHLKDSSAIRMSNDGEYIYISTRTQDVISVFKVAKEKLDLKQIISSGGKHPRDFCILQDVIIILNRDTNTVVVMDLEKGLIKNTVQTCTLPEAVALLLEEK